jgi:hypothetical protein
VQQVNGREVLLDASKFVHTQYIELNREAWGVGKFHSLLTTFDYGSKKRSLPQLEIYRRQIQLFYKVLERYGSPVTVWFFDNVSKAEFDRQVEELRALEAGDRRILSKKVEIATETIDGRGNLINATSPVINQEIEAGLQTSANRLITQPSAMADARVGSDYDDAKTAAIMEKIRRVMNVLIIPRITSGRAEFRWGKQDNFEFDFNQLLQAKSAGFVSAEEGRAILKSVGWKLDDGLFGIQQLQNRQDDSHFSDEYACQSYCATQEFNQNHDERGRFSSGGTGSKVKRSSKIARPVSYTEAEKRYTEFASKTTKKNYSFDPTTNESYDVSKPEEAKEFHKQYAAGDNDVYVVGVTNNTTDKLNEETKYAYNGLLSRDKRPFIGKWTDPITGIDYVDISHPESGDGIKDAHVRKLLSDNKQKSGIAISKDGKVRIIE